MRHGKKVNHLKRKVGHRRALLRNLSIALIEHKRIKTTLAKAKALRIFVEPIITKSKDNTTHSRRTVFSKINDKEAVKELYGPISEAVANRPGGYTRIIKTGFRKGDSAEMAIIELVDFNNVYEVKKGASAAGKSKSRRGRKKAKAAAPVASNEEE